MYYNIGTEQLVNTLPRKLVEPGIVIHNPTNSDYIRHGWRKVRNEIPSVPEGMRHVGYVVVDGSDNGKTLMLDRITEEDPYAAERQTYLDALVALQDAKSSGSVPDAILALEEMIKSVVRVVNGEIS